MMLFIGVKNENSTWVIKMKYSLVLSTVNNGEIRHQDKVEADDLLQLASQFNMVLLTIQRMENEKKLREFELKLDSDIPF